MCAVLLSIPRCVFNVSRLRGGPSSRPPSTLKPHVSVFLSYRHVIPAALTHARRCRKVKTSPGRAGRCRDFTRCERLIGFRSIYSHVKTF